MEMGFSLKHVQKAINVTGVKRRDMQILTFQTHVQAYLYSVGLF
jgi:hypothetical protein